MEAERRRKDEQKNGRLEAGGASAGIVQFKAAFVFSEPARAADGMRIVREYGRHGDFVYNLVRS